MNNTTNSSTVNPTISYWRVKCAARIVFEGDHNSVDNPSIAVGDIVTGRVACKWTFGDGKRRTMIVFKFNDLTGYAPVDDLESVM